jgi:hypothetical protein
METIKSKDIFSVVIDHESLRIHTHDGRKFYMRNTKKNPNVLKTLFENREFVPVKKRVRTHLIPQ